MSKAKSKNTAKRPERKPAVKAAVNAGRPSDALLIRLCVQYAQAVAAYHAGFDADTNGNGDNANLFGTHYDNRANKLLADIAGMRCHTFEGVNAKSRILRIVLGWSPGTVAAYDAISGIPTSATEFISEVATMFCYQFARDVKHYTDGVIQATHTLRLVEKGKTEPYFMAGAFNRLNRFCIERGLPVEVVDRVMAAVPRPDEEIGPALLAFCTEYNVTLDWILMGKGNQPYGGNH